jgi:apolipoprotein N-acyltransferase
MGKFKQLITFNHRKIFMPYPFLYDIACLLIGATLPFAFAPFDFYPLAILLPALLIPLWHETPKRVFWRGFLFGCGFFGVGASWVFVSIHLYGNAPIPLAGFLTVLFVATLALFSAGQALTYRFLFPQMNFVAWCLGFPILWALWEWVRTWLLSGFPWNFLSYSQIDAPLAGFVPVIGVYGTTALVVCISGLIAYAILQKENWRISITCVSACLVVLFAGMGLRYIEWTQPNNDTRQVSLIQGNIPQEHKWDKAFVQSIVKVLLLFGLKRRYLFQYLTVYPC